MEHMDEDSAEAVGVTDNIQIENYDLDDLLDAHPDWREWSEEKQRAVLTGERYVTPSSVVTDHNTTTRHLHTYIAAMLNNQNDFSKLVDPAEAVVLGTGTSGEGFSPTDDGLNNPIGEIQLTDPTNSGPEFIASELIGSAEYTEATITELGIRTESGGFWNLIELRDPIERSSGQAHLLNFSIPITDAMENN